MTANDEILRVTFDNWKKIAEKYYGVDKKNWEFFCPICNRSFSVASLLKADPNLLQKIGVGTDKDFLNRILANCGYKYLDNSCQYCLYGLIQIGIVIIEHKGDTFKCFRFSKHEAHAELFCFDKKAEIQRELERVKAKCLKAGGSWLNFEWDDWIPLNVRRKIEDIWDLKSGRIPMDWFEDFKDSEPIYGSDIIKEDLNGKQVKGKYIHKCNNIGLVIESDSVFHYVSS